MDNPNPPNWTLKYCFDMFCCIWVHLGSFRNCMKLVAKHTEQVQFLQKLVPRSHDVIFRNERTQSTPLDPKLTCWCVSNYLGASRTVWLPYETRCKTGRKVQKFVPRSRVRIFRNERTRFSHLDPKLMFWCVSYDLGAIGTVWLPYENRCKTG